LEKLCQQKEERLREFSDVQSQIQKICGEIAGNLSFGEQTPVVDESDLSLKKLEEYQAQLQELQREKVFWGFNTPCTFILQSLLRNISCIPLFISLLM